MPFSLINSAAERIGGVAPGFNEILPGWVLSDNMYTVVRNSLKYERRQRQATGGDCDATYATYLTDVLRWDTIEMLVLARACLARLSAAGNAHVGAPAPRVHARVDARGERVYLYVTDPVHSFLRAEQECTVPILQGCHSFIILSP